MPRQGKPLRLHEQPIWYQVERYMLNNRSVQLIRRPEGWRLVGPRGTVHRGRVPGTGRYAWATIDMLNARGIVVIKDNDETGRPACAAVSF